MTSKPGIQPYIKRLSKTHKVLFGTISGIIATVVVHPFDVIKIRLQISEQSFTTREMARRIWRCEGPRALYCGLGAGVMRQATYTTARLTAYQLLNERTKQRQNVQNTSSLRLDEKVLIGAYAGLAGALVGTPSEVALVRMMADGPIDPCSRGRNAKRYRGVLHAFYKIAREDGITALWRGGSLTMTRSLLVSVAQIGTYAKVTEMMKDRDNEEGMLLHIFTSVVSSFVTTMITLPVDIVKSRYQVNQYTMTKADILQDIVDKKGVFYLWKGIIPYFIRMSIHTTATLIIFENLTELYYDNMFDE